MNVCENCQKAFNYEPFDQELCAYCMRAIVNAEIEKIEKQELDRKYAEAVKEINGILASMDNDSISVIGIREEAV